MALPVEFTTSTETKPGIYTTEFWTTLFTNALAGAQLLLGPVDVNNKYVVLGIAFINGIYAVSRGIAKNGAPHVPEVVEAELSRRANEDGEFDFEEGEIPDDVEPEEIA